MSINPRCVSLNELADWLGISRGTLYSQRHRGQNPGALGFKMGKRIFFDLEEVMEDARRRRDEQRAARS